MIKDKDMIGQIFGDYKIIERDFESHPNAAARYWRVKCIHCNKEKICRSDSLKTYPNCKCQKTLVGQNFGDFLVIEKLDERANDNCILYKCQCIHCGHLEKVGSNVLRSNRKHCSKCHVKKSTLIDLTGQTFGMLQVLKQDKSIEHMGHKNDAYWICKCLKCGTIKPIRGISLRKGMSRSCGCIKSHGEETIAKILTENNIPYKKEYTFPDLYYKKENCKMRFDFAILDSNNKLIKLIEYDGCQHFQEGVRENGWNNQDSYLEVKKRDEIKNRYCKEHFIKLTRIKYDEEITLEKLLN